MKPAAVRKKLRGAVGPVSVENRFMPRYRTILGLIEMRKAGEIKGIWCDGGMLSISRHTELEIRVPILWANAADLVAKFQKSR